MKIRLLIFLVASTTGGLTASSHPLVHTLDRDSGMPHALADTLWDGCSFKGIDLHGKVRIVEAFPDIKVQLVDAFPDIRVKWVDVFPDDCGQWQEVDAFPDFTIQMVDAFPDVKVQIVESFPGIGRREEG